jgi:hypothetical protein
MTQFWMQVLAGVVIIAITVGARWLWKRRDRPVRLGAAASREVKASRHQLLVERAVTLARQRGDVFPLSRSGYHPVTVERTDGSHWYHLPNATDEQISHYIAKGGQPQRTDFVRNPPRLISEWSNRELRSYIKNGIRT